MPDQSKYISKLQGAKVLIIGGSSGIGFGVAEASLEYGAHVTISSSNPKRLDDAVSRLKKAYPSASDRIAGRQADIGNQENIEKTLAELLESVGKLDHIVWTAADPLAVKKISEVDIDFIRAAGTTRFLGPMLLGKLAPKYLNDGPKSSIIFTSGGIAERPIPDWTVIGSYATGLYGLTRGLALDIKPIRVNIVSPGGVDTALWDGLGDKKQALMDSMAKGTTTGSIGQVEDVAESYIYLMKDKNITGQNIATNSGSMLLGPH